MIDANSCKRKRKKLTSKLVRRRRRARLVTRGGTSRRGRALGTRGRRAARGAARRARGRASGRLLAARRATAATVTTTVTTTVTAAFATTAGVDDADLVAVPVGSVELLNGTLNVLRIAVLDNTYNKSIGPQQPKGKKRTYQHRGSRYRQR